MSVLPRAMRTMRIIALPLAPAAPSASASAVPEHLTYYHFVTSTDSKKSASWLNWAVAKASDLWAGLGKAEEGTWKVRVLSVSIAFPSTIIWIPALERPASCCASVCALSLPGLRRTLAVPRGLEVEARYPCVYYYART